MFFKILGKLPNEVGVGCSGGVDSLTIVHYLMQCRLRKVHIHYVWHHIDDSPGSLKAVVDFYEKHKEEFPNLTFTYHEMKQLPEDYKGNDEHYWHKERYSIFNSLNYQVVTGHHLSDQLENWIMSSLIGNPKLIAYQTLNVIRPFLLNKKDAFYNYAKKHKIEYYTDVYNSDLSYRRNRIRHQVMDTLLDIHPGFYTTIENKIKERYLNEKHKLPNK